MKPKTKRYYISFKGKQLYFTSMKQTIDRTIRALQNQSDRFCYLDTDSIHVRRKIYQKI